MHLDGLSGQQRKKLRCVKVGLPFLKTTRMESGAGDEDLVQSAMIHYEIETEIPFKLRPGGSKRHKSSGFSSFNIDSGEQSINLNTTVGDTDEDEMQEIRPEGRNKARAAARKKKGLKSAGSSNVNEDALAKSMVTEMTA
nr:hypothetical protein [Tanacetum cinerariifolium]